MVTLADMYSMYAYTFCTGDREIVEIIYLSLRGCQFHSLQQKVTSNADYQSLNLVVQSFGIINLFL